MASALSFDRFAPPDRALEETSLFLCAWCDAPIPGRQSPAEHVDFGICPECLRKELDALGQVPSE